MNDKPRNHLSFVSLCAFYFGKSWYKEEGGREGGGRRREREMRKIDVLSCAMQHESYSSLINETLQTRFYMKHRQGGHQQEDGCEMYSYIEV